jgi:hypothetical protein
MDRQTLKGALDVLCAAPHLSAGTWGTPGLPERLVEAMDTLPLQATSLLACAAAEAPELGSS